MPQIQIDIKTVSSPDLVKTFGEYTKAVSDFYKAVESGLQNLGDSLQSTQQAVAAVKDAADGLGNVQGVIQSAISAVAFDSSVGNSSPAVEPVSTANTMTEKKKRTEYALTWDDQFQRVTVGIQDKWGDWSKQMADTFSAVFEKAISSISSGITGLIEGTKTWAQALHQISSTILNTVISAFVEMGVRYVMTKLLMSQVDSVVAAKSRAETAANLPGDTAGGLAKAGEQGGWYGLAAYVALFVAGMAILSSVTAGARASGGPVMAGMPYIVGEKRPELFVPNQNGFILPSVPQSMDLPTRSSSGGAGYAGAATEIHFAGIMDSEAMAIKGLSGKQGRKFLLDFNKGSVREVHGRG